MFTWIFVVTHLEYSRTFSMRFKNYNFLLEHTFPPDLAIQRTVVTYQAVG